MPYFDLKLVLRASLNFSMDHIQTLMEFLMEHMLFH